MPDDFAPTRLVVALAPIPRATFFFWNSNALLSWDAFRRVALPVSLAGYAWLLFVLSSRRDAAILFGAGAVALVALFGLVYGGDVRHHGFLFVLLLMGAWLVRQASTLPEGPDRDHANDLGSWRRFRGRALVPTLMAVLVVHIAGTPIALYYDATRVFSSGARAAAFLREHGLVDAPLVAEVDYPATAALGYLGPHAFAISPRTGRPFSFVKWTHDRLWDPTDEQSIRFAADLGAARGEDAVLLMNRPLLPELVDGLAVVRLAELYDSMIEEENFYVYRVARRQPLP
jgi:hypothetical protein